MCMFVCVETTRPCYLWVESYLADSAGMLLTRADPSKQIKPQGISISYHWIELPEWNSNSSFSPISVLHAWANMKWFYQFPHICDQQELLPMLLIYQNQIFLYQQIWFQQGFELIWWCFKEFDVFTTCH